MAELNNPLNNPLNTATIRVTIGLDVLDALISISQPTTVAENTMLFIARNAARDAFNNAPDIRIINPADTSSKD